MKRREFVTHLSAAALAAGGAGMWLSGCRERRGIATRADGIEPKLNIYNWSDYIGPDTVRDFEREFGVRVTYDTYESNEEMAGKLLAGASGYDIVVPTGYLMPVLSAQGLLAPLNKSLLPNFSNIAPLFLNPTTDPGNTFGVPWQWGLTGIAYRQDKVPAPRSWAVFTEGAAPGRMTMLDDGREVLGAMLKYRGHSLNTTDAGQLTRASQDAITAKRHLAAFVSAPVKGQLAAGDVWMAQLWNGDARQAAVENPNVGFALPREGSLIWTDYAAVLANCPHPNAAYAFLNYVLRPEVGAALSDATGYGTPNQAAAPLLKNPVAYPTTAELARLEFQVDLGPAAEIWDRLWTEVKAA